MRKISFAGIELTSERVRGYMVPLSYRGDRMTSYNRALEITGCESIETTLRTRRLLWAGTLLRMSGGRLPKRIVFGNLEGAVRRGRGEKEKEWTDCVQSDIRAFGITGDWETMAVKAEV